MGVFYFQVASFLAGFKGNHIFVGSDFPKTHTPDDIDPSGFSLLGSKERAQGVLSPHVSLIGATTLLEQCEGHSSNLTRRAPRSQQSPCGLHFSTRFSKVRLRMPAPTGVRNMPHGLLTDSELVESSLSHSHANGPRPSTFSSRNST